MKPLAYRISRFGFALGLIYLATISCMALAATRTTPYSWSRVTERASYPVGYNYPVFVARERMWALHAEGTWSSVDGSKWRKENLPSARHNVYESQYVLFNDSLYALGMNSGNYLAMQYQPTIRRSRDFQHWEILAKQSNLPRRIFFGLAVFKGKICLLGGLDGKNYQNDVWNSVDGIHWTRAVVHAEWSPRSQSRVIVYQDRLWMIGGGVIDGEKSNNPRSEHEVWSSTDGVKWQKAGNGLPHHSGGTPVVFDNQLWLVGANRDGRFGRSSLVTTDGLVWREEAAPWTPRGGVAAWVYRGKLWMTGGKYSVTENGELRFIYSNDVWAMSKSSR